MKNSKDKLKLFKAYCVIKKLLSKYGYMRVDENGKLFIDTLEGKIITDVAYQNSSRYDTHPYFKFVDKLISLSYATCDDNSGCEIGKPKQKCVDNKMYTPDKCAVVFPSLVDLDKFTYELSFDDFNKLKSKV